MNQDLTLKSTKQFDIILLILGISKYITTKVNKAKLINHETCASKSQSYFTRVCSRSSFTDIFLKATVQGS